MTQKKPLWTRALRKVSKYVFGSILTADAVAIGIQYAPELTSDSLKDYARKNGMPESLAENFKSREIRIYHRYNPLSVFHVVGYQVRIEWNAMARKENKSFHDKPLLIAAVVAGTPEMLWNGFWSMNPKTVNAWSWTDQKETVAKRECFIHMMPALPPLTIINEMAGFEFKKVNMPGNTEKISRVFHTFVLGHEARHCDQDFTANASSFVEADADLFAMDALPVMPGAKKETAIVRAMMQHQRIVNGLAGDFGHYSTGTIENAQQSLLSIHDDVTGLAQLRRMLSDADAVSKEVFKGGTKLYDMKDESQSRNWIMRYYHLTRVMQRDGLFEGREKLKKTAADFVAAIEFFNRISEGQLIKPENVALEQKIQLGKFFKKVHRYKHAPAGA